MSTEMKQLPDDPVMEAAKLSEQRARLDDKLATLFQRWPALDRTEIRELRQVYGERLKIARQFGSLRRRGGRGGHAAGPGPSSGR